MEDNESKVLNLLDQLGRDLPKREWLELCEAVADGATIRADATREELDQEGE